MGLYYMCTKFGAFLKKLTIIWLIRLAIVDVHLYKIFLIAICLGIAQCQIYADSAKMGQNWQVCARQNQYFRQTFDVFA